MKLLDTAGKAAKKAAAAVVKAVTPPPARRSRDPWYYDDEHVAEVNARSSRGGSRWLGPQRGGWLR